MGQIYVRASRRAKAHYRSSRTATIYRMAKLANKLSKRTGVKNRLKVIGFHYRRSIEGFPVRLKEV